MSKPIRIRLRQVSDAPEDVAVEIRRALEGVVAGDWPDRIAAYYLAEVGGKSFDLDVLAAAGRQIADDEETGYLNVREYVASVEALIAEVRRLRETIQSAHDDIEGSGRDILWNALHPEETSA